MAPIDFKKFPLAAEEIAKIFGFLGRDEMRPEKPVSAQSAGLFPVEPVVADTKTDFQEISHSMDSANHKMENGAISIPEKTGHPDNINTGREARALPIMEKIRLLKERGDLASDQPSPPSQQSDDKLVMLFGWLRKLVPYVLVFSVGLFAYYFYFAKTNIAQKFSELKNQTKVVKNEPESQVKDNKIQELVSANQERYNKWISGYYYDISDKNIADPEHDNSKNGLTNFQKFLLGLNPKSYDSLGLGAPDSETLQKGLDPLTGKELSEERQKIVNEYFDFEIINNRLTLFRLQDPNLGASAVSANYYAKNIPTRGEVAGESVKINPNEQNFNAGENILNHTQNYNSFSNIQTNTKATDFSNNSQSARTNSSVKGDRTAPQTGADNKIRDQSSALDVNENISGILEIPSLNVSVPVIWSKSASDFTKDLQNGVIHYPGTAMPGEIGNMYISGHSSNYAWAKGKYNKIFSNLGDLKENSTVKLTVTLKSGAKVKLHYIVKYGKEFLPTDQEQFRNGGISQIALSTCWPVNTTKFRLVVFADLVQTENM